MQSVIRDIHEAERSDTAQIRAEIIAGHLRDMRDESLEAKERRAARIALARMLGLETQVVEVKGDAVEAFARLALYRAAAEPMVKNPME